MIPRPGSRKRARPQAVTSTGVLPVARKTSGRSGSNVAKCGYVIAAGRFLERTLRAPEIVARRRRIGIQDEVRLLKPAIDEDGS